MFYARTFSSRAPSLVADPLPEPVPAAPLRHEPPSKTMLRVALELAHPLSRNAQLVAELGQGRRLPLVQPVPAYQDVPLADRHPYHRLLKLGVLHLLDHRFLHLPGS